VRSRAFPASNLAALLLVVAAAVFGSLPRTPSVRSSQDGISASAASATLDPISAHDGRFWAGSQPTVFHGVNVAAPCCNPAGFATIRSQGMNFVRLWVRWTALEPTPPVKNPDGTWTHSYDLTYLGQIEASIASATAWLFVANLRLLSRRLARP